MADKPPPQDEQPDPEGWARFEHAVDVALRTPAKHQAKTAPESSPRKRGAAKPKG